MKKTYFQLLFLIVPLFCWAQASSHGSAKNHNLDVAKNLDIFNQIYKNLDLFYVDTLNPNEVIGTGIKAMLRSLDPYTEYYPESETKNLKMMLTGKYAGIGALIRYHQKLKRVVIDEPYEGMPASEVGLKKGDIILSIDDSTMTDKDVSYVSSHLRGDAGTNFVVKIQRPSTGKKMSFKITRRAIKLPELPYYGIIEEGGTENEKEELQKAIEIAASDTSSLKPVKSDGRFVYPLGRLIPYKEFLKASLCLHIGRKEDERYQRFCDQRRSAGKIQRPRRGSRYP